MAGKSRVGFTVGAKSMACCLNGVATIGVNGIASPIYKETVGLFKKLLIRIQLDVEPLALWVTRRLRNFNAEADNFANLCLDHRLSGVWWRENVVFSSDADDALFSDGGLRESGGAAALVARSFEHGSSQIMCVGVKPFSFELATVPVLEALAWQLCIFRFSYFAHSAQGDTIAGVLLEAAVAELEAYYCKCTFVCL